MGKQTVIVSGQFGLSKNPREVFCANHVTSGLIVVVYDMDTKLGGMYHFSLPDSRVSPGAVTEETRNNFLDIGMPLFVDALTKRSISLSASHVKLIGGAQLFNFSGGSGNILNIGTRNAVTARTLLTQAGFLVEKADTGGNKPRTVALNIESGCVYVNTPGQAPKLL